MIFRIHQCTAAAEVTDSSSHVVLVCFLYNVFLDILGPAVSPATCSRLLVLRRCSRLLEGIQTESFLRLRNVSSPEIWLQKEKGPIDCNFTKIQSAQKWKLNWRGLKGRSVVFHSWPPDVCQPGHLSSRQRGPRSRTPLAPPPLRNQCPRKRFQPGLEASFSRNSEL